DRAAENAEVVDVALGATWHVHAASASAASAAGDLVQKERTVVRKCVRVSQPGDGGRSPVEAQIAPVVAVDDECAIDGVTGGDHFLEAVRAGVEDRVGKGLGAGASCGEVDADCDQHRLRVACHEELPPGLCEPGRYSSAQFSPVLSLSVRVSLSR